MSITADLRLNAAALRGVLASHVLPEEVAQAVAAAQLNLDYSATLLESYQRRCA